MKGFKTVLNIELDEKSRKNSNIVKNGKLTKQAEEAITIIFFGEYFGIDAKKISNFVIKNTRK